MNPQAFQLTPLDYGAGYIDPSRAMDPNLVYDLGFQDYVKLSVAALDIITSG